MQETEPRHDAEFRFDRRIADMSTAGLLFLGALSR
jgi:hypothetical protein